MTTLAVVLGGLAVLSGVRGVRLLRSDLLDTLPAEDLQLLRTKRARRGASGLSAQLSARLAPLIRSTLGESAIRRLQGWIDEAGRPNGLTVDALLGQVALWGLMGAAAGFLYLVNGNVLVALLVMLLAGAMPVFRLSSHRTRRRSRIDRDLPDFLDVLAVTVMAGVGFQSALARVGAHFPGPLQEEVDLTLQQIANGASVRAAFTDMASRTSSEAMSQFVSALLQSQELGAPLAESLGNIASDMRRSSAQRQRQRAARKSPQVALLSSVVLVPGVLAVFLVGIYLSSGLDIGELMGGFGG